MEKQEIFNLTSLSLKSLLVDEYGYKKTGNNLFTKNVGDFQLKFYVDKLRFAVRPRIIYRLVFNQHTSKTESFSKRDFHLEQFLENSMGNDNENSITKLYSDPKDKAELLEELEKINDYLKNYVLIPLEQLATDGKGNKQEFIDSIENGIFILCLIRESDIVSTI